MHQGYILGIGSNIETQKNIPRIVKHLVYRFGKILVSRFYETKPVGMESNQKFINFCAFISTDLEPRACKAACVAIEIELGRDRTHLSRKTRDRVADIDLLTHLGIAGRPIQLEAVADYLAEPAADILALLSPEHSVSAARESVRTFMLGDVQLGKMPAAVDRDGDAGLIVLS